MPDNVLPALEQALVLEKKALKDLLVFTAENQNFRSSILNLIEAINFSQEHVILSGVGKSGYIARCVSSSFSSAGIPSFFLHPIEAVHGELGALTARNLLLLITKSGETAELKPLIKYAKKHAIKIAIITTSPSSTLAKQSDILISVPISKESGIFSSAPTTSSLLFLALANALITTIAQSKKISKETFWEIHPGGSIGKNPQRLSEIITHSPLPLIPEQEILPHLILEMNRKGFSCVGVINEAGKLIGEIRERNLQELFQKDLKHFNEIKACDIMSDDIKTLNIEMTVKEALDFVEKKEFFTDNIFVVDLNNFPIAVLRLSDLNLPKEIP